VVATPRASVPARPERFVGHDGQQWQKFQPLPNLIYSVGSEWSRRWRWKGRAFFASADQVGEYVLLDYLSDKRRAYIR
jgi:hypothetical protein